MPCPDLNTTEDAMADSLQVDLLLDEDLKPGIGAQARAEAIPV